MLYKKVVNTTRRRALLLTKDLLTQLLLDTLQHRPDVVQELIGGAIPLHDLPQFPGLFEIAVHQVCGPRRDVPLPLLVERELVPCAQGYGSSCGADVVGVAAVVAVDSAWAVALVG